ncbi:MAG: hypothetical protein V4573_02680 [Pseudomonadota bacterium]
MSTTLGHIAPFSSASTTSTPDFVSSDIAALASHMDRCASTRGRFFGLHLALESARCFIFPRMVTAALVAVVLMSLVATV